MIYQAERKIELLDSGTIDGYYYYILNLGTHPTAYVQLSPNHPYFGLGYSHTIDEKHESLESIINVNGGITYASSSLLLSKNESIKGWFIGWDYAHCMDYAGYSINYPEFPDTGKKWTTKEILEEVKGVIEQLKKLEAQ